MSVQWWFFSSGASGTIDAKVGFSILFALLDTPRLTIASYTTRTTSVSV